MSKNETGIAFRAPTDLYEKFKRAVAAEHRSVKGSFLNYMEQQVAEHESRDRQPIETGKAA